MLEKNCVLADLVTYHNVSNNNSKKDVEQFVTKITEVCRQSWNIHFNHIRFIYSFSFYFNENLNILV